MLSNDFGVSPVEICDKREFLRMSNSTTNSATGRSKTSGKKLLVDRDQFEGIVKNPIHSNPGEAGRCEGEKSEAC
jgi:hypothetical protein